MKDIIKEILEVRDEFIKNHCLEPDYLILNQDQFSALCKQLYSPPYTYLMYLSNDGENYSFAGMKIIFADVDKITVGRGYKWR